MLKDQLKICLVSLGCPKNLVDAEMMLGFLKEDGFGFAEDPSEATVIVVNTCGFIEGSKRESIDHLLRLSAYKKEGRCRLLIATGCLSQRYSEELTREMPEVDLFIGTSEFDRLSLLIRERLAAGNHDFLKERLLVSRRQILPDPGLPRVQATPQHYRYVKISEGCSHICSFCIIPKIRGGLKSRPIDSIVREVKEGVEQGVREFNLIAQDLNEYGRDLKDGSNLERLLKALDQVPGDFWIRPLYMYPLEFNDRLIDTLKESEHVVKYVDIPLQHISERILLSMKRGSPSRYVRQLLTKLKTKIPSMTLRTTFIVGYPGETEEEFEELSSFLKEYEFDRVGVFTYSMEEGTTAAELRGQLPEELKKERYDRLMSLQQKISFKKNRVLVGRTFQALCEGSSSEEVTYLQMRLASQAPEIDGVTYLPGDSAKVKEGDFCEVKIVEAREYDLIATSASQRALASRGNRQRQIQN